MILRVSLFAASALLVAGVLSGKAGDVAPSEPKSEISSVEDKCAETPTTAPSANAEPASDTPHSEASPASASATPNREPSKASRKHRPTWPPPPELIA